MFRKNRGNVLFLILLAVALFAALSYAVTQSNRSGGKNISDEGADLAAARIMQHASLITQSINRLLLTGGCKKEQISLAYDTDQDSDWTDGLHYNANSPSDFSCHVFHPNGGGVSYIKTPAEYTSNNAEGILYFASDVSVPNVGSTVPELSGGPGTLKENICLALNKRLGHIGAIPVITNAEIGCQAGFTPYTGSYPNSTTKDLTGFTYSVDPAYSFCYQCSETGNYNYMESFLVR